MVQRMHQPSMGYSCGSLQQPRIHVDQWTHMYVLTPTPTSTSVPICTRIPAQHVSPWPGCVPISGNLQCAIFHATGYAKMQRARRPTIPEHAPEMKNMNRGVEQNEQAETIARAIWEGNAIMGTDGSVRDPIATHSFVISISRTDVKTNVVRGGGFLPPTTQYLLGLH
jgi:hypothetical protein